MEIFGLDAFIVIVRLNEVWKKDFRMRPIKCIYYPTCNSKNPLKHTRYTHTHTNQKGRGLLEHIRWWREGWGFSLPPALEWLFLSLSYLPVLVRTTMALAQHLKDASTAPTATASEGSRVSWECLLSSSNSCLWKVAASASRAIWVQSDHEGVGGGRALLSIAPKDVLLHNHSLCWERLTPLCSATPGSTKQSVQF